MVAADQQQLKYFFLKKNLINCLPSEIKKLLQSSKGNGGCQVSFAREFKDWIPQQKFLYLDGC